MFIADRYKYLSEQLNSVIHSIEQHIKNPELSELQIGYTVAMDNGIPFLNLCVLFYHTTGDSLYSYIRRRRMNYVNLLLQEKSLKNKKKAIEISGCEEFFIFSWVLSRYSDPSWMAPDKRKPAKPPLRIGSKSDVDEEDHEDDEDDEDRASFFDEYADIESLSGRASLFDQRLEELTYYENTVSAISENMRQEYVYSPAVPSDIELEYFFVLPRLFTDHAHFLAQKTNHSLYECYCYSNELEDFANYFMLFSRIYDDEKDDEYFPASFIEHLCYSSFSNVLQHFYFKYGIPPQMIGDISILFNGTDEEILNSSVDTIKYLYLYKEYYYQKHHGTDKYMFWEDFIDEELKYADFINAYNYFEERYSIDPEDDTFFKYIDEIINGNSPEDALDLVIYSDHNAEIIDDYFLNLEERPTVSVPSMQKNNQPLENESSIDAYLQKLDILNNSELSSTVKETLYNPDNGHLFLHPIYGKGSFSKIITENGKEKIYIRFKEGEKRFNFPDCFSSGSLKIIES